MRCVLLASFVGVGASGCAIPVAVGALDEGSTGEIASTTGISDSTIGLESSSSSSGETDTGVVERRDLAIRHGDLPDVGGTGSDGGSSASTSGGSDIDPDALLISVGIGETTCDDPYGGVVCSAESWEVSFTLPVELQFVGAQGDLFENLGFNSVSFGPPECGFGGGTLSGTFEITGLDDAEVRGTMMTEPLDDVIPTSIEFVALRCG